MDDPRVLFRKSRLNSDEVRPWAVPQGIQIACLADTKLAGEFLSSLKGRIQSHSPMPANSGQRWTQKFHYTTLNGSVRYSESFL
jgi:hypothetical protein